MYELTHELLRCPAMTAPGILALLSHLAAPEFLFLNPNEGTGETILSGAIEMLAAMLRNSIGMFGTRNGAGPVRPAMDEAGSPR